LFYVQVGGDLVNGAIVKIATPSKFIGYVVDAGYLKNGILAGSRIFGNAKREISSVIVRPVLEIGA
jgi:hypothetical protein